MDRILIGFLTYRFLFKNRPLANDINNRTTVIELLPQAVGELISKLPYARKISYKSS
ncbi:hypothetical protein ISX56_34635, partial [Serratia ureilytica]|nr:hypothetical protein [Serratia ureilytica]